MCTVMSPEEVHVEWIRALHLNYTSNTSTSTSTTSSLLLAIYRTPPSPPPLPPAMNVFIFTKLHSMYHARPGNINPCSLHTLETTKREWHSSYSVPKKLRPFVQCFAEEHFRLFLHIATMLSITVQKSRGKNIPDASSTHQLWYFISTIYKAENTKILLRIHRSHHRPPTGAPK